MPTAPAPSLHELDSMIESFVAAGVKVDWEPPDSIGPLPDVIELTAYRVIQESLTNVLKHAPGATVRVRLARHEARWPSTSRTPPPARRTAPRVPARSASTPSTTGHGLLGMRERVSAVGGELTDRAGAGWRASGCMLFFLSRRES